MLKYLPNWAWWYPSVIPAAGCWVWTSLGSIVILPTNRPTILTLTVTLLWSLLWHLTSFQLCIFWNMRNFYCKDLQLLEFKNWFLDFSRFWRSRNLFQATLYSSNNTLLPGAWFILFAKSYWSGNGSVNAYQLSTYRGLVSRLCLSTWYKLESCGRREPELFGGSLVMFGIWCYHFVHLGSR